MNIYTVKIKGEDWQVVAIAENARRAKVIGYKAIDDIDPQCDARFIDIRVKKVINTRINNLTKIDVETVFTSCNYNPFFCELWDFEYIQCENCGYAENKERGNEGIGIIDRGLKR